MNIYNCLLCNEPLEDLNRDNYYYQMWCRNFDCIMYKYAKYFLHNKDIWHKYHIPALKLSKELMLEILL